MEQQIPHRTGITPEAAMHSTALNFVAQEQALIGHVGIDAELGEIAEETFAGIANAMQVAVTCYGQ